MSRVECFGLTKWFAGGTARECEEMERAECFASMWLFVGGTE